MRPALGWAGLSRSALKRAEAQLVADSEGVRDEVGVLALHTAYANRFFPGTSVQQTRLRYTLFVPWQIMALLRERVQSGQARRELDQAELNLARRLPDVDGEGTKCRWVDSLDPQARMSQSAVIIAVGRTGRVLARYELPMFALVGWTSGTGWPEKAI